MSDIKLAPIGLNNIEDITQYSIANRDGYTIHTVTFSNGGKLKLTVATYGQPKVVTDKLDATVNPIGGTIFSIHE